jgi:hypothetical protein
MIKWLLGFFKRAEEFRRKEWAHVPPPSWGAKRGGRDYW